MNVNLLEIHCARQRHRPIGWTDTVLSYERRNFMKTTIGYEIFP